MRECCFIGTQCSHLYASVDLEISGPRSMYSCTRNTQQMQCCAGDQAAILYTCRTTDMIYARLGFTGTYAGTGTPASESTTLRELSTPGHTILKNSAFTAVRESCTSCLLTPARSESPQRGMIHPSPAVASFLTITADPPRRPAASGKLRFWETSRTLQGSRHPETLDPAV